MFCVKKRTCHLRSRNESFSETSSLAMANKVVGCWNILYSLLTTCSPDTWFACNGTTASCGIPSACRSVCLFVCRLVVASVWSLRGGWGLKLQGEVSQRDKCFVSANCHIVCDTQYSFEEVERSVLDIYAPTASFYRIQLFTVDF